MYMKSLGSCDVQRWDYKLREALTEMCYTTHEEWMLWILFRRERQTHLSGVSCGQSTSRKENQDDVYMEHSQE